MGQCHIENEEAGAPTLAPLQKNSHWLDTTTGDLYLSKGTASVADWVLLLTGAIAHSATTGQTANDHHSEDHQARHNEGGEDALKLDDLAVPDDNTDLDVSTSKHGLTPKLPNDPEKYLDGEGNYTVPPGSGGATVVAKSTDETLVSSTTLQDDDELKFAVGAGESYSFELLLFISELANNPNIKFRMGATGGLTGSVKYSWRRIDSPSTVSGLIVDFTTDTGVVNLSTTEQAFQISGTVKATNAGTLVFQWAQATSDDDYTKVHALSKLVALKQ